MTDTVSNGSAKDPTEEDLARKADNYSTRIENTLGMIEAIEKSLLEKRRRFKEIKATHESLTSLYKQLGKSLDAATADLTHQFTSVIDDLGNGGTVSKLLTADKGKKAGGSDFSLEDHDLPPIPDCLREFQDDSKKAGAKLDSLQAGFNRMLDKKHKLTAESPHRKRD